MFLVAGQKEKYLYSFLADLIEEENLPCVDKKMEPFHQVFKKQVIIMDQFAKILRFFLKEVSAVSEGRIDLESNELVRRFFAAIFDEMKNLSQLSSKVSQMAMYRKHADIAKAELPVSVKCHYISTRRELVRDIRKQTSNLKSIVHLTEGTMELVNSVMHMVKPINSTDFFDRFNDLKSQLQEQQSPAKNTDERKKKPNKAVSNWADLAKALPKYL
ncbi:unnamed protein product [Enterobius vermicularis]|uniref:Chromosome 1 open reading frame 146 n=1 Tax=Enterobius vermicularis TaxID=51028 RepID=A0A0N4VIY0_ENTVE|nr:unnamed protein product [Enterobius vermicularis]